MRKGNLFGSVSCLPTTHPGIHERGWESQPLISVGSVFRGLVSRFLLLGRLDCSTAFVAIRGKDLLSRRSLPQTRADAARWNSVLLQNRRQLPAVEQPYTSAPTAKTRTLVWSGLVGYHHRIPP